MSFAGAVGSSPSAGVDSGMKAFVRHSWKEIERKTPWKIVSLRVPGTADRQKCSSAPDVIRICQKPYPQKKPRRTSKRVDFVVVPDIVKLEVPEMRQTSSTSSIPSVKRCSLDEIEAIKSPTQCLGRTAEKGRGRTTKIHKTHLKHPQGGRTHLKSRIATLKPTILPV